MKKNNVGNLFSGMRSSSLIAGLFIGLIVSIVLLFANFTYLNVQAGYDTEYITHAGELRVLSQRIAKNATEGLGHPRMIVPMTVLLLCGQVLPVVLLGLSAWLTWPAVLLAGLGALLLYSPRVAGMSRFRQGWLGAVLHPIGVLVLVLIQWHGLFRRLAGRPAGWRGRAYPPG